MHKPEPRPMWGGRAVPQIQFPEENAEIFPRVIFKIKVAKEAGGLQRAGVSDLVQIDEKRGERSKWEQVWDWVSQQYRRALSPCWSEVRDSASILCDSACIK